MSRVVTSDIHPGRGAVLAVVVAGCLISLIGFGVRGSFGLFLDPMTVSNGWSRQTFAFAMAVQNLLWGIGVPIARSETGIGSAVVVAPQIGRIIGMRRGFGL